MCNVFRPVQTGGDSNIGLASSLAGSVPGISGTEPVKSDSYSNQTDRDSDFVDAKKGGNTLETKVDRSPRQGNRRPFLADPLIVGVQEYGLLKRRLGAFLDRNSTV